MTNTLGIVQIHADQICQDTARGASRAARRLGGKSVLEWVVRRATDCQGLDRLIVMLPDTSTGRMWGRFAPPDVDVHYSAGSNALAQLIDVLDHHPAHAVIRICAQNIFIDPALVDRLAVAASSRVGVDYIGYADAEGRPATHAAEGLFAEWLRADALRCAHREAHLPIDRERPSRFIYTHPEEFGVLLLPLPEAIDLETMRRTLDVSDNWELAQAIYEALGPDDWDLPRVAELVASGASVGFAVGAGSALR